MYNTDFIVKYKEIEGELIKNLHKGEQEYNLRGVYDICHELYKHELQKVFGVNDIDDPRLSDSITEIWSKMKDYKPFLDTLRRCKLHIFLTTSEILDDDVGFVTIFSYSAFHVTHKCICQFLAEKQIKAEYLEKLIEEVDKI
jgi:hypothetical protein